ncbi:D-glucuronyl C5-epimerase family protein [Aliarcobacter skirrowii]|uniref:D-glucuronyl C5-epimerase family protein n=1 Tax=Aliarcobacter skirrowii TaxID=28200 RepID=UPI00082C1C7B|nr:D-glucuronyl C5-epimerase family protein [Aliarcobacter skirrowii]
MGILSHGKVTTVLQYFTDKFDDYWHILYPVVLQEERNKDKYLYFYDISRKAIDYTGEFSDEGIYLFYGYDGNYHIHALELSQYSLACWLAWRKTDETTWLNKALLHCDWLVKNQEDDGAWRIEHKNPSYTDLPSPWPSSLAQGLAISSLIRAYKYTSDDRYLASAKKACNFLDISIDNNGVKREFILNNTRGFIYEEYPRKELNGVLNGYLSAIFGIYELSLVDNSYSKMFDDNLKNLKEILPLFDLGYWSYYALDGNIDSGFYHRLIVKQLKVLSEIDSEFNKYYKKFFQQQENKYFAVKAFIQKIRYKL